MTRAEEWRPTASRQTLRLRADVLALIRAFFAERGVMEVETPALSRAGATDLQLEAVGTQIRSLRGDTLYLMTSPEYAMKRMLAAECGDIYQICRVFRDEELGRWHQPEFTLLEWYREGWDDRDLMTEVETLLRLVLEPHQQLASTVRLSYRQAFRDFLNVDVHADPATLTERLAALGVDVPVDIESASLVDLAFGAGIAPRLDPNAITFIYDFPANQAALARIKPGTPPVAARFEAFVGEIELANGFDELTDEPEQRARFEAERTRRLSAGRHAPPLDEALLAALSHGLPQCAGVAVGVDRLIAVAAGLRSVSATMSFAHAGS